MPKFSTRFPYVKKSSNRVGLAGPPPAQRIIIPQGLISSSKTTVIEIPENLQNLPTVIAKPKEEREDEGFDEFQPGVCSTMRHSYIFPKPEDASASLDASQYTQSVYSSGMPQSRSFRQAPPPPRYPTPPPRDFDKPFAHSLPRAKGLRMPYLHESGVTYGGMGWDYSPNTSGSFYKDYVEDYTSIVGPHFESDETPCEPCSVYTNFEPIAGSTPKGYVQSAESYLNALDYSVPARPCSVNRGMQASPVERGLRHILDTLELEESYQIQKDLKDVQHARRKLIYDASSVKY